MTRTKACTICGETFKAYGARAESAQFCSVRCKGVASRKEYDCETCGEPFYGAKNHSKRWCSRDCASRARRNGETRQCALCGKAFYVPKVRVDAGEGAFCSSACHNLHQGRNKTEHICKICGAAFRWSPSRSAAGTYRITYCSWACRDADPLRRQMLVSLQAIQQLGRMTKTEALGYALLEALNVGYERQVPFGMKFTPDAVIPSARLVIQFDGDYWHDRRGTSTEPRIMQRVALDRSQDRYIRACGWDVVRLWDSELKNDLEACRQRVVTALQRPLGPAPDRDPLAVPQESLLRKSKA